MTRPACHVHMGGTNRGPHEDGEIARPKQIRYSRNGLASYTLEFFLPTWEYSATGGKPLQDWSRDLSAVRERQREKLITPNLEPIAPICLAACRQQYKTERSNSSNVLHLLTRSTRD